MVKEIIDKNHINYETCNKDGDSYLHLLVKEQPIDYDNDEELKNLFELILIIISKKPSLILLQNRKGMTPYLLAARNGCNTALSLMSLFYPPKIIESYSINTSALHEACYFNKLNTVRFLIEYLNYDVNKQVVQQEDNSNNHYFNAYSTPLHCAAKSSSFNVFQQLLQYGANPFLKDSRKRDAISIALEFGNKNMLDYIMNSPIILHNNHNHTHLISLTKNHQANNCIKNYIMTNPIYQYNSISDEYMNNLLMISCTYDNPDMINFYIHTDIEILSQNKNGNNILHLCCYSNSTACASEILSKIKKEYIDKLLSAKNNDGDTPLHVAVSLNNPLLIVPLFLSFMDNENKTFIKNNSNLSVIQQSIKSRNFEITSLLVKFYNLTMADLNVMEIPDIAFEFKQFITYYSSEQNKNSNIEKIYHKILSNKVKPIEEVINYQDNGTIDKIRKELKNKNYTDYKTYNGFNSILSKIYKSKHLTNDFFTKYHSLIGNKNTLYTFIRWVEDKKEFLIDKFILTVTKIDGNKYSLEMCNLFLIYLLYYVDSDYAESVLNELNELILFCNKYKNTYYFVQTIHGIILSYLASKKVLNAPRELIFTIKNFRLLVESEPISILENLRSIKFNIPAYQFINNLIRICNINSNMKLIQIKYANFIPPLLQEEVDDLIQKYPIIHEGMYSILPLDSFIKTVLSIPNISNMELDISLKCDQYIKNSSQLTINEKIELFNYMIDIVKKGSNVPKSLFSFAKAAEIHIIKFEDINHVGNLISRNKDLNQVILKLNKLNGTPEFNFDDFDLNLVKLISRINFHDNPSLIEIANYFNIYYNEYSTNKNFSELGRQLGQEFRENPTLINMAKLLAIIMRGFEEVINYTPYLIQIFAVSSFLLHYTKENKNHGRLAQIKTGEGKSMIIAILALSNALMGYFVDVITSTHYLAKRDQVKFKKLFSLFGVSSSNIAKQNPSKEDYNGIILYGMNTDFEFTLLREGIFIQNKNWTQPLGESQLVRRQYHVSIVDECDNLFLDTALNSARIAYTSKYHYNWVYDPIFNYVKNNNLNPKIEDIRNILKRYEDGVHQNELVQLTDEKIENWIHAAKFALTKTINKDYIIGFNEELQKKEVQIISSDTGRIQYGSRWSRGIHEFVEVKEGLVPEEESSVIGCISHPTYFQNYQTIFGLTGTIGEEIEKNEISKIYDVEIYNLPRNFEEKLVIEKAEVCDTKSDKYNRIIEKIFDNIQQQPMLILLENIQESLEFSNMLRNMGLNPLLLNDAQKEKEEYILEKAGDIGSILVSTNAAGRGTDIILSKAALKVGGLHVILGFFPQNSRIEFQGIGRAGRQGQEGKAQIIFSKDESFVKRLTSLSFLIPELYEDVMSEFYYKIRNNYIEQESQRRIEYIEMEKISFKVLQSFFYFKHFLLSLFNDSELKNAMESETEPYSKFLMKNIDQLWSDYYSEKVSERDLTPTDNEHNLFIGFLEYFLKEIQRIQSCDPHFKVYKNNVFINIIKEFKTQYENEYKKQSIYKAIEQ